MTQFLFQRFSQSIGCCARLNLLKEVKMARDAGIPIFQIIGYKDGDYTPVPNAGRLYSWSWPNLKKLLA